MRREGIYRLPLALLVVLACLLAKPAYLQAGETPLLEKTSLTDCTLLPPVNALGPIPANGAWEQDASRDGASAIVATGRASELGTSWTIRTAGDAAWTDYHLSATVTIRKPTPEARFKIHPAEWDRYLPREMFPPMCQHTGQYRYRYFAGEFDWGSDAALFFRHTNRLDCYRVQLSTRYQEIILWHGVGGYLQVVPCELKVGQAYKMEVLAQGAHIRVLLDGQEKINYWHATLPTFSGRIGLGAYHATVGFRDVRVTSLPDPTTGVPPHQARFDIRRWRTVHWLFDGNEPISAVAKDSQRQDGTGALFLSHVKLLPGYRAYYHGWIGVSAHSPGKVINELVGDVDAIKLRGRGTGTLELEFDTRHPKGLIGGHHKDRLTFDRTRGTYRHEMTTDVKFLQDTKLTRLEFFDPLTYNNKPPGRGVRYPWLHSGHEWGIVLGEDGGLYRHPISQSLNLFGQNNFISAKGKGFWMLYPDRAACPAFEYQVPGVRFSNDVCHWGWDWHQNVRWGKLKPFKVGDRFRILHAMTAYPPSEAERLFRFSALHPHQQHAPQYTKKRAEQQHVPDVFAFPVCDPAGTDFTRIHNVREPFVGWPWRGRYRLDRTVGHTDRHSLRMDGPAKVNGFIYHHMFDGYGKQYLCTVWLKTQGVTGPGPTVKLKARHAELANTHCDVIETGLTGDNNWTRITFVTTIPTITLKTYDSSTILIELKDRGTVWVDDFSLRPVEPGEKVQDILPKGAKRIDVVPQSK